jgi:tetratricopeptide (TPR) repeat protein
MIYYVYFFPSQRTDYIKNLYVVFMKKLAYISAFLALLLFGTAAMVGWHQRQNNQDTRPREQLSTIMLFTPTPTPPIILETPPAQKILPGGTHVFQSFNNCGPASLSMALSLYGISVSQQELGLALRPYQNPQGDNDDKSVTLAELAEKSKEYGFVPYLRPGGNMKLIQQFITYDIPVIVRTTTTPTEDIGHFRVIKGYDDATGEIIQDDSLQGKNIRFTYEAFTTLWEIFGYEFLVLVPAEKVDVAQAILGELADETYAWRISADAMRSTLAIQPNDLWPRFNLAVALYHIGDYQGSVEAFEQIESHLPFRTLWYQIEPIRSYYELGNYDRVFALTNKVLNNENRAFSELYVIRGTIYKNQGNVAAAQREFEKAVLYNQHLKAAQDALQGI